MSGKTVNTKKIRYAYTIPLPYEGRKLPIQYSANAWWMDESKIPILVNAFMIDATIPEACAAAGITLRQYKYFITLHPEFNDAREMYKSRISLVAKKNIAQAIFGGDLKTSMWYLIRTRPEEFGRPARRKNKGLLKWEQRQKELEVIMRDRKNISPPEDEALRSEYNKKLMINIDRRKRGLKPIQDTSVTEEKLKSEDVEWDDDAIYVNSELLERSGHKMRLATPKVKPKEKIPYYDPDKDLS